MEPDHGITRVTSKLPYHWMQAIIIYGNIVELGWAILLWQLGVWCNLFYPKQWSNVTHITGGLKPSLLTVNKVLHSATKGIHMNVILHYSKVDFLV